MNEGGPYFSNTNAPVAEDRVKTLQAKISDFAPKTTSERTVVVVPPDSAALGRTSKKSSSHAGGACASEPDLAEGGEEGIRKICTHP